MHYTPLQGSRALSQIAARLATASLWGGANCVLIKYSCATHPPNNGLRKPCMIATAHTFKGLPTRGVRPPWVGFISMPTRCANPALPEESRHAEYMQRIAQGEHAALGELYDATLGKVYGFALRLTGKPESAEEVVGDVFLQTWRQAARFDASRGSVMAWLMMLTRSRALDLLRRADHAESHPEPDILIAEIAGEGGRPVELLLATELRLGMNEAMQSLSPVQRQLIALAFFRDLSHQEIADHTQLPLGTVKSHIRRALEKLRPLLEQHRHG